MRARGAERTGVLVKPIGKWRGHRAILRSLVFKICTGWAEPRTDLDVRARSAMLAAVRHCPRGAGFRRDCLILGEGLGWAHHQDSSIPGQREAAQVRWISRSASFVSSRGIAFDMIGPDKPGSAAAAKEPVSAGLGTSAAFGISLTPPPSRLRTLPPC
jgi:hypothetical protein